MVNIIGHSDKVYEIICQVKELTGIKIRSIFEINKILDNMKKKTPILREQYRQEINTKINTIKTEILELTTKIHEMEEIINIQINDEIANLIEMLKELENLKFSRNIIKWISNKIRKFKVKRRLNYLTHNRDKELKKQLEPYYKELMQKKKKKQYYETHINALIGIKMRKHNKILKNLKTIIDSRDYLGALGEMAVIREAKKLPDTYFLLNNLFFSLPNSIEYDVNRYVKSAQVDHIIVGPTGVFVIETKYWSRKFYRKFLQEDISSFENIQEFNTQYQNDLFYPKFLREPLSPYKHMGKLLPWEQIERNSFLVRFFIDDLIHKYKIQVYKVIATLYAFSIPDAFEPIDVVPFKNLASYIQQKVTHLEPKVIKRIVKRLKSYVLKT